MSTLIQSQQWAENLPPEKVQNGELTFYEIQDAFYQWCDENNVIDGFIEKNGTKTKVPGWKQFKRWEWKSEYFVDGDGNFPQTSTMEEMEKYYMNNPDPIKSTTGNWTNIGYNNTNAGYQGIGRVNCIAFHPTNNNIFWIGAPSGGLWVTTNGGSSWNVLTDNNTVLGVSAIAVTSNYATSNTIYIGTGDRDGGSVWSLGGGNIHDNEGIGVLKSTNGGSTWTSSLSFNPSQKMVVYDLLIDPTNNNILYAATDNGIYETINAGVSWSQITTNVCTDLEFKPGNSSIFYGAFINPVYIIKFTKSGTWSWTSLTLPGSVSNRTELAVSANNSNVVYALTVNSGGGLEGIYKSTDSGATYSLIFNGNTMGNNFLGYDCTPVTTTGQGTYDVFITANPSNANDVYIGGINVWRSTNGGSSWTIKSHWSGTCGSAVNTVHADQHCCEFQNSSTIFIGNDGGVYKSTDAGSNWTDLSNGLTINQIYRLGLSAQNLNEIITGLQDNGTHLYSGGSWVTDGVLGGDGMECLIDPINSNIQIGEFPNGAINKTTDHWTSYSSITSGLSGSAAWVTPLVIDPNDNTTIYAGYQDVFKSIDQGANWTQISTWGGATLRSLAIAPSNSSYIYAATQTTLFRTTIGGTSWSNITGTLPVTNGNITYVTVKNDDPNTVWVTIGGYNTDAVYQTTNGGTTWTNISTGLPSIPAMCIVQNVMNSAKVELYVAMTQGVWVKYGASNWIPFKSGLPNVFCTELEIFYDYSTPSNSKIRVATFGRGLWESDLPVVDFAASNTLPPNMSTPVSFTDLSTNSSVGWFWTFSPTTVMFTGGTGPTSQNPIVQFTNKGAYTVTLTTTNAFGNDSQTKSSYIHVGTPGLWTGALSTNWNILNNWDNGMLPASATAVTLNTGVINWPTYTGNLTVGTDCGSIFMNGNSELTVTGNLTTPSGSMVSCGTSSKIYVGGDWNNTGGNLIAGNGTVEFNGSANASINSSISNSGNLTTTYASGWSQTANYFDIVASGGKNISINSFDVNCNISGNVQVEIWYTTGAYAGQQNNPGAWIQLGTTQSVMSVGTGNPIPVNPGASISVPSGATYGFYISCYAGPNGCIVFTGGNNNYSNSDITINCGDYGWTPQPGSGGANGYSFNGTVYYSYTSSFPLSFWNVDVSKSLATLAVNDIISVSNDLSVNSAAWFTNTNGNNIAIGNNLTIEPSGSFIDNGTVLVTGTTVVKNVYNSARWHYVSSPVSNATSNLFLGLYLQNFDESTYTWNNIVATNVSLLTGAGYNIWSISGNPTINYMGGPLNNGNISVAVSGTDVNGGGLGSTEGWNLVGNPYTSAIDWGTTNNPVSGYVRTNLDNTIYFWNGSQYANFNPALNGGNGLGLNGGTQYIPSMQGFFIKASNTSPVLTIPANAKIHTVQANYKISQSEPYFMLKCTGNGYSDEILISQNENASSGFDSQYDAYKIWGIDEAPQLYSIIPENVLSINTLPEIEEETVIELGFKVGVNGNYAVSLEEAWLPDTFNYIVLEDIKEGCYNNLKDFPEYYFNASTDDDPHRFNLRFTNSNLGIVPEALNPIRIWSYKGVLFIDNPKFIDASAEVFDLQGKIIYACSRIKHGLNQIDIKVHSGIYLVKITSEEVAKSEMLIFK